MPPPPPCRRLILNGRFLSGQMTAVNSVARDLSVALGKVSGFWQIEIAVPPTLESAARGLGLPVIVQGTRSGIAWEQRDFASLAREGVLAGFFNTVPLRGRGHVTMLHDTQVFDTPQSYGRATRMWRRLVSRRAGAEGNFLLAPSEYSRQALLRHGLGTPERIGLVPNGLGAVARGQPDPAILSRLGLAQRRYCLALSTVLPHKNIALLLQAFRDPRLADVQLVLFGRASRDDFAAAGMISGPNVIHAGFVSDAELAALYEAALATLVPSVEEGFGLPALEAMAKGSPAVVSDRGALPEVVGPAGIVLPATDPAAWVAALCELRDESEHRRRVIAAGQLQAAGFTWEAAARKTLEHLDRWFDAT